MSTQWCYFHNIICESLTEQSVQLIGSIEREEDVEIEIKLKENPIDLKRRKVEFQSIVLCVDMKDFGKKSFALFNVPRKNKVPRQFNCSTFQ